MSDTPRTDAKTNWPDEPDVPWVEADFARKLERENAALRADKERLAGHLEELLRLYCRTLRVEIGELCPENSITFVPFYAAIDAARKEKP